MCFLWADEAAGERRGVGESRQKQSRTSYARRGEGSREVTKVEGCIVVTSRKKAALKVETRRGGRRPSKWGKKAGARCKSASAYFRR